MAARRVKNAGGGRLRLTVLLIAFLSISGAVILRRSVGNKSARELADLEAERASLVDQRLRLESEIRSASSRAKLVPITEQKLNMRVPPDSSVIFIEKGARP